MRNPFRLFRSPDGADDAPAEPRVFTLGEGQRVYAIGDIHGRYDLLRTMIEAIVADQEGREVVPDFRLILLGDLIDRGPDSANVVDLSVELAGLWPGFACLMGNHEEIFAEAFLGHPHALRFFRGMGRETLVSYGIDPQLIGEGTDAALHSAILTHVPEAHRDFIIGLPSVLAVGDYLFVHAGIRPGVPLEGQHLDDLHWIRDEFLTSSANHSHMVVHGHSITEFVDEQPNRIGIDTGAFASDKLTAIGLEGTHRWFLST